MGRKATVKDRVLACASELFYQKGYNNTGINEIIEKSGIAKASLYANFRTKEELCLAYLQNKDVAFRESLLEHVAAQPKGDAQILAIFDFLLEFYHSKNFRGCWCLNTLSELPQDNVNIKQEILEQKKQFRALIQNIVLENSAHAQPDRLSNRIYLVYEGAITESYLHRSDWPIQEAKDLVEELLSRR